ncbi:MAG: NifU family protein [Thermonemataceae bacterium]|nr:NifU family protein [Thermonemataceae bacterium]
MEKNAPKRYVNVYTEANPNPSSLKFVVNYMLSPEGTSFDFPDRSSAEKSPLAQSLFENFEAVERVFVMNNFITVTKKSAFEWDDIARNIKLFIQEYLEYDKPIFSRELLQEDNNLSIHNDDSEVVKKIKGVLEEYIRPAVESDGGAISFRKFEDNTGKVIVSLQGACSGCPSSMVTLKAGIENLLKRMIPEVQEVVAESL